MPGETVRGLAWTFGDDVDTDTIIPSQYMRKSPDEYARHAMEPLAPEFGEEVGEGDVVVAGTNFGIGSSREQAVIALDLAGVGAVLAESFARTFFRNAINEGFPVIEVDESTVASIDRDDELEVEPFGGTIRNVTKDETYTFEPFDEPIQSILEAGGAIPYYQSEHPE